MHYKLSYPVSTVLWDGKKISNIPLPEIEKQLDTLQSCGIAEVMLAGYHDEEPATFDMMDESGKIGNILRSRGIKGAQHHSVASSFAPVGTSQREIIRRLKRYIDYTANLNTDIIVFHTGKPFGFNSVPELVTEFRKETAKHGLDNVMHTVAENIREAGEYAKQKGIQIALENIDLDEPLSDPVCLPKLLRMIAHPSVGFCLDTGHAWCSGSSISKWIDDLGDILFTTHIHDNHGIPPHPGMRGDEHLPPGFGTISWRDVIAALIRSGYSKTLNFESGPWPVEDKAEGYRSAIRYWRICEEQAEKLLRETKK